MSNNVEHPLACRKSTGICKWNGRESKALGKIKLHLLDLRKLRLLGAMTSLIQRVMFFCSEALHCESYYKEWATNRNGLILSDGPTGIFGARGLQNNGNPELLVYLSTYLFVRVLRSSHETIK
jgi:hypothetical protein